MTMGVILLGYDWVLRDFTYIRIYYYYLGILIIAILIMKITCAINCFIRLV